MWDGLIGMILGESFSTTIDAAEPTVFIPSSARCSVTYSYLLAKSISLGYEKSVWKYVYQYWYKARDFFGMKRTAFSERCTDLAYEIIDSTVGGNPSTESSLFENFDIASMLRSDFDSRESLMRVAKILHLEPESLFIEKYPKEDRLKLIKSIITKNTSCISDPNTNSFIIAYLVNLISPGTMQHQDFLRNMQVAPSVWIWYGLCAGLSSNSKVREIFKFIGRKIFRDVTHEGFNAQSPKGDMSIQEALMLFDSSTKLFRQLETNKVVIDFLPGIEAMFYPINQNQAVASQSKEIETEENNIENIIVNMQSELDMIKKIIRRQDSKGKNKKAKDKQQKNSLW